MGDAPARPAPVYCQITFASKSGADRRELFFRDFIVPIGSPENNERIEKLPVRDRLEGFPLLHHFCKEDPADPGWLKWIDRAGLRRSSPDRGIRFQRVNHAVEAVIGDAGLALSGLALIEEPLKRGEVSVPYSVADGSWTNHAFQARFRNEA